MSTRTFTLEQFRVACAACGVEALKWAYIQSTLLAAKPEAKTCEPWCNTPRSPDCADVHGCHAEEEDQSCKCSPACQEAGRPLNPAPAASPPATGLPLRTMVAGGVATTETVDDRLAEEIEHVINRHSRENASGTPDFILSEYLMGCLAVYERTIGRREDWHGRPVNTCAQPADRAKAVPLETLDRLAAEGKDASKEFGKRTKGMTGPSAYVDAPAGQPGVPAGWKLGDGWTTRVPVSYAGCFKCGRQGASIFEKNRDFMYCGPCGHEAGAIVPVEPSRPGTGEAVHPMQGTWIDGKYVIPPRIAPPAPGKPTQVRQLCAGCGHPESAHVFVADPDIGEGCISDVGPAKVACGCMSWEPDGQWHPVEAPGKPDAATTLIGPRKAINEAGKPDEAPQIPDHPKHPGEPCPGCQKVARHPGEGYSCAWHPAPRRKLDEAPLSERMRYAAGEFLERMASGKELCAFADEALALERRNDEAGDAVSHAIGLADAAESQFAARTAEVESLRAAATAQTARTAELEAERDDAKEQAQAMARGIAVLTKATP